MGRTSLMNFSLSTLQLPWDLLGYKQTHNIMHLNVAHAMERISMEMIMYVCLKILHFIEW